MSDRDPGPGMVRALGWVGLGVLIALAVAAVLTPAGAYDLGTILPLLAVIVVGTAITLLAGARRWRDEADRRLIAHLDQQDGQAPTGAGGSDTDDRAV